MIPRLITSFLKSMSLCKWPIHKTKARCLAIAAPFLEELDGRNLPAYYWVGTGSGNWEDVANWSTISNQVVQPAQPPGNGSAVIFQADRNATISLGDDSKAGGVLVQRGAHITLQGGKLTVGNFLVPSLHGSLGIDPEATLELQGVHLKSGGIVSKGAMKVTGSTGIEPSVLADSLSIDGNGSTDLQGDAWVRTAKLWMGMQGGNPQLSALNGSIDIEPLENSSIQGPTGMIRVHPSSAADESPYSGNVKISNAVVETKRFEIMASSPSSIASLHMYGTVTVRGTLVNQGSVILNGLFRVMPYSGSQAFPLGGDYTQSGNATLVFINGVHHRLQGPAFVFSVDGTMKVAGTFRLAGFNPFDTLHWTMPILDQSYAFLPPRSPFFSMRALFGFANLEGRFEEFLGAQFAHRGLPASAQNPMGLTYSTDRFIGLDYQEGYIAPMLLETPRSLRFDPSLRKYTDGPTGTNASRNRLTDTSGQRTQNGINLVLVASGTAATAEDWPIATAGSIAANAKSINDWDVAVLEWKEWNTGTRFDPVNPDWQPLLGSAYGVNIGESLAHWMKEVGLNYRAIHVISHSGGAWLVDAFANQEKAFARRTHAALPFVHETLLDAFYPVGLSLNLIIAKFNFKRPFHGRNFFANRVLGLGADYADQFIDTRQVSLAVRTPFGVSGVGNPATPLTDSVLDRFFNVDVTGLSPTLLPEPPNILLSAYTNGNVSYAQLSHAWPRVYYASTAAAPSSNINVSVAFPYSYEFSGVKPRFDGLHIRASDVALGSFVPSPDPRVLYLPQGHVIIPNYTPTVIGITNSYVNSAGLVFFDSKRNTIRLNARPGLDAVLTARVEFKKATDALSLGYALVDKISSGVLTLSVDGRSVAQFRASDFPLPPTSEGLTTLSTQLSWIPAPGKHTVAFRLQAVGAPASINFGAFSYRPTTKPPTPNKSPVNAVPKALLVVKTNAKLNFTGSNRLSVLDLDAGEGMIRITLAATHGTLSVARTSGVTIVGSGTATLKITGVLGSINRALAKLTFRSTAGFSGFAKVTMVSDDLGNTGGGGAKKDTDIVKVRVTKP